MHELRQEVYRTQQYNSFDLNDSTLLLFDANGLLYIRSTATDGNDHSVSYEIRSRIDRGYTRFQTQLVSADTYKEIVRRHWPEAYESQYVEPIMASMASASL